MNIFNLLKNRFNNIVDKGKGIDRKTLNTYKYTLFFLITANLIGVYYFLHLKKIGIFLLVIFLFALGFIMFLESKLPEEKPKIQNNKKEVKKMPEKEETVKFPEVEEVQDEIGLDFGLPDPEEYNKRLNDAFEFKGLGSVF